jgi:hypothetical protein
MVDSALDDISEGAMEIVGGTYRELCEIPHWDAEFGSGGRAAAALSTLSPKCVFHTYACDPHSTGLNFLRSLGVDVRPKVSDDGIAFAYFHPLSRPHIEPPVTQIVQQPAIYVDANTVLRFGLLEGEAVVKADRAIYDPQTSNHPQPFHANGSTADSLALVINESELRAITNIADCDKAAQQVFQKQSVDVLIVKAGTRGAVVYEASGSKVHVAAYRSSKVFKIGTGDVFSAVFAHYWGENHMAAHDAAVLASKCVSKYCSDGVLPLKLSETDRFISVGDSLKGAILLEGYADTLGSRYVMEEARFHLRAMGARVVCPALEGVTSAHSISAILIIADGYSSGSMQRIGIQNNGTPTIIYREKKSICPTITSNIPSHIFCEEFVTAIYFSVWAAMT